MGRLVGMALLLALAATAAQAGVWRGSWGASPALPLPQRADIPPKFASPAINNQTVVQIVRLSVGGERLRLRLSNEFGEAPLQVGHVRVALIDKDGHEVEDTAREVTFGGSQSATAPPLAPLVSDPVALRTPDRARLKLSLYFPADAGPCTCHADGGATAQISPAGDFTDKPFTPVATTRARTFLSEVDVETAKRGPVIVAFGDSITDGYLSTADADRRWPDRLAERLAAGKAKGAAVVNAGIGGNRVLSGGALPVFGIAALARFDRDVLSVPGVSHVVVLEGVNDLGARPPPPPDALIAGYRQLIARAHAHGVKLILGTILPYGGATYFRPEGEAARSKVNDWIRTQREADGVVDFDKAVRDPAEPTKMRKELQSGDWLHPNDAGYRAMGEAVPLALFR